MAINFPASPSTDETYTENSITWVFNGTAWNALGEQITPSDIGLGNVDNTADADKQVSTAQQAAIDLKMDITPATATKGVLFNGSSQYGLAGGVTINGDDFTIEVIMYRSSVSNVDQKIIVLDRTGVGTPVFQLRTGSSTGGTGKKLLLQTWYTGYLTAYTDDDIFTDTALKHIKVIKTGTSVDFYVNGELRSSSGAVVDNLIGSSTDNLYIGRRAGAGPNYFDGGVFMAKIYSSTREGDVCYDFENIMAEQVIDESGYQRTLALTGSPTQEIRNYGGFTLDSASSTFALGSNIDGVQACDCDGTHVWFFGNTKVAKFTVGGTLVEGVTSSGGLTSWGGAHLYNGRLYAVQFSESVTNKVYSFDPDDLATAPTLEKELTEITTLGCNGLHRLDDGTWLTGFTNSTLDIDKANTLYQLDASFVLIREIAVPIAEMYGIQEITETPAGLYINGHSATGATTKMWRIRIDNNVCRVVHAVERSQNIGCVGYDPTSREFIIGNRDATTCDFHPISEDCNAPTD